VFDSDVIGSSIGGVGGPDVIGRGDRVGHRGGSRVDAIGVDDDGVVVDQGLLVRRLADLDRAIRDRDDEDLVIIEDDEKISIEDKFGIDGDNFAGLTLARDGDDLELGDLKDVNIEGVGKEGFGFDKGDLYAYNFPSQGVGAGIGNSAVGAGAGGGAGIGAGGTVGTELYVPTPPSVGTV
jgi:hypothetical protein